MNETRTEDRAGRGDGERSEDREAVELVARIEQLEEELDELHARYQRIRQSQYRGTALALGLIGLATVVGALAYPGSREVLFALGGTGLFAAALIYYLTPERFIAADVGEHVYESLASNQVAIVGELGLQSDRVYLPVSFGATGDQPTVRLFVPQRADYTVPPDDALETRFVITADETQRGMAFEPSAAGLVGEFETTLSSGLSESPSRLVTQLIDGLVNGFELVDSVTPEVARAEGRARFGVDGSAYAHVDRFDNPVTSFLAVGLAAGLRRPVTTTVTVPEDGSRADFVVTCEWPVSGDSPEEPSATG